MKHFSPFVIILLALAAVPPPQAVAQEGSAPVLDLAREVEQLAAEGELWPGFDPLSTPLAIYDGERTYLFRHPDPPEAFAPLPEATPPVYFHEGRHPAVTANSAAEIGGVPSATLLLGPDDLNPSVRELAGTALHEAFHVYQRAHHPGWIANEADLFVYPVEETELLALRRLETEALRRAQSADEGTARCWAQQAIDQRRLRYARMDSTAVAYERGTELNEGLAQYVEDRALGARASELPEDGFGVEAVRSRAYATGAALAFLLDRFAPGWPRALAEREPREQHLDTVLAETLAAAGEDGSSRCRFSDEETETALRTAGADVEALLGKRIAQRAAFESRPGWRVVIEAADGAPLWPQGFDPLNAHRVEGGVLHTRFLQLGNENGALEVLRRTGAGLEVLTEAAGEHPLFNGVRRVVLTGLSEPEMEQENGTVAIHARSLTARFEQADVSREGEEIVVRLRAAP